MNQLSNEIGDEGDVPENNVSGNGNNELILQGELLQMNNKKEVMELLNVIPSDLSYNEWFRVAAAVKNEGLDFAVFDRWSRTAGEKYDEKVSRKTWEGAGAKGKPQIGIGTLRRLAACYSTLPAPAEMLPEPETITEMARQCAAFVDTLFQQGEYYEMVWSTFKTAKGRIVPRRNSSNELQQHTDSELRESRLRELEAMITSSADGAYISVNPLHAPLTGTSPADADVSDFRFALIEVDALAKQEQWRLLHEAGLPIVSVVDSGNKSLHAIVRIEAGTDAELYRVRVQKLYTYLTKIGFPVDSANKNPSRLTRLPGVYRNGRKQYLVAGAFGPKCWNDFERISLKDRCSETSAENGKFGGRPPIDVTGYAESYLAENEMDGDMILRYWRGDWWHYDGKTWKNIPEDDLSFQIAAFLQQKRVQDEGRISNSVVRDVLLNLQGLCGLSSERFQMPCWLPNGESAEGVAVFRNGILPLRQAISDSSVTLRPCSPKVFSRFCVDYDFDPAAQCPMWMEYLNTTFDDEAMREALQMLFGYILSGRTDMNVGFFWIGRGGDGKSVAAHILRKLVGEDQTCCLPFANMADRFSSGQLTTHILNLVEELPVTAEMRNIADLEKQFKMVTDGAFIPVEEKYKPVYEARVTARCVFLANELPAFTDRTNGLWDRLVVIPFTHRFRDTGEEKPNLKYDLESELPGILLWTMTGARKLTGYKRFPLPEASQRIIRDHRNGCDHEACFLQERVVETPEEWIPRQQLYIMYRGWCENNGYKPFGADRFKNAVKITFPNAEEKRMRTPVDQMVWKRIALKN